MAAGSPGHSIKVNEFTKQQLRPRDLEMTEKETHHQTIKKCLEVIFKIKEFECTKSNDVQAFLKKYLFI